VCVCLVVVVDDAGAHRSGSLQKHTFRQPAKPLEPLTPRGSLLGLDRLAQEKREEQDASRKRPRIDDDAVFKGEFKWPMSWHFVPTFAKRLMQYRVYRRRDHIRHERGGKRRLLILVVFLTWRGRD